MFDRLKSAALVTLLIWGVLALVFAFTPKTEVRDSNVRYRPGQSTYDVWELAVHAAANEAKAIYRFPIINDRKYEDSKPDVVGYLYDVDVESIPVGGSLELDQTQLRFRPIGQPEIKIEGAGSVKMRATLRHLKSCAVEMSEVTESRIVNTGSGIIAVPKLKKETIRKFSEPACRGSDDFLIEKPNQESSRDRQAQIDKEEVLRSLSRARADRERIIVAGWRKQAEKLGSTQTTDLLRPTATSFERDVCSRFVGLFRVLGVEALNADRVLKSRAHHDGYDEEIYETKAALLFKSGRRYDYRTDLSLDLPFLVSSLRIDDKECVKSTPPRTAGGGFDLESKSANEIEKILAAYMREAARAQAESEIPNPSGSN